MPCYSGARAHRRLFAEVSGLVDALELDPSIATTHPPAAPEPTACIAPAPIVANETATLVPAPPLFAPFASVVAPTDLPVDTAPRTPSIAPRTPERTSTPTVSQTPRARSFVAPRRSSKGDSDATASKQASLERASQADATSAAPVDVATDRPASRVMSIGLVLPVVGLNLDEHMRKLAAKMASPTTTPRGSRQQLQPAFDGFDDVLPVALVFPSAEEPRAVRTRSGPSNTNDDHVSLTSAAFKHSPEPATTPPSEQAAARQRVRSQGSRPSATPASASAASPAPRHDRARGSDSAFTPEARSAQRFERIQITGTTRIGSGLLAYTMFSIIALRQNVRALPV